MPIAETDYAQTPGSCKSSGFRCRIQAESSYLNNKSQLNHSRPCPVADIYAAKSMGVGDRARPSRQDNLTNCQSLSQSEYSRDVCNHGNKLLIHHQRHSLKTRFHLLRTLGEGTYGKVKLAADKGTGEHVAIKYIRKTKIQDENDRARIRREIRIMSSLKHKHVVSIREVFEKKDKIVLVMDYVPGGELYDHLDKNSPLPERESRRIFRQIVSAVHHCHVNGIVHRDLKLENIILDEDGNVKMADFGLSNYYSLNNRLSTFCGSPLYASPEIVNGQPYHGPEVDVWSLGVILYTLVYGAMPFESANLVLLKRQISTANYIQPSPPSDAAGLIRHMLTVTTSRRAGLDDVLRHWWVNLGYPNMPNDMPYSPDLELSQEAPMLRLARRESAGSPCVAHDSCNSSMSSDSDVEPDFQPSSRKFQLQGNMCNARSSPPTFSNLPSYNRHNHCPANTGSSASTFPQDVLEILTGCRRPHLASTDNIFFALDVPVGDDKRVCQQNEELSSNDNCFQTSLSTFDSEKKPTKGILKRKGKFSGGDSGCVMPEDMATKIEDFPAQELDELSRELNSLLVSSNDAFDDNKQDSCHPADNRSHCVHSKNGNNFQSKPDWSTNFIQSLGNSQLIQLPRQCTANKNLQNSKSLRDCFTKTISGDVTNMNSPLNGNHGTRRECALSKQTPTMKHESISRM